MKALLKSLLNRLLGRWGAQVQEPRDPRHVAHTELAFQVLETEAQRLAALSDEEFRQELDENYSRQAALIARDLGRSQPGVMVYGRSREIISAAGVFHLDPKTGGFKLQEPEASAG
jgi:hypothetical protein